MSFPRSARPSSSKPSTTPTGNGGEEEEDEEDERMNLETIQGFASKIQHRPAEDDDAEASSRTKIVIPKRGEKDFEPLAETVNLQEMMLQRSREAMFGALTGVRGTSNKSMSHAFLPADSQYPRLLITRGHLLDTMGMSIRHRSPGSSRTKTYTELLPEEALYLLERGTLQIWTGYSAETDEERAHGVGEWDEGIQGVKDAVELSVMEGFGTFIGQDDLTWERYQAYSYLKRLGYTVQRNRQFIPDRFLESSRQSATPQCPEAAAFRTWWLNIPNWLAICSRAIVSGTSFVARQTLRDLFSTIHKSLRLPWLGLTKRTSENAYASILEGKRYVQSSHSGPCISESPDKPTPLSNPYLPFWHVWKPASPWSKGVWNRGHPDGLAQQRPEYIVAVINARDTPLPSRQQLAEVFQLLPDEPKGPVKKIGPQYARPTRANTEASPTERQSIWLRFRQLFNAPSSNPANSMGILRNGDRALIVAVNDSGNTGWVRFGRTGFCDHPTL